MLDLVLTLVTIFGVIGIIVGLLFFVAGGALDLDESPHGEQMEYCGFIITVLSTFIPVVTVLIALLTGGVSG